MFQILLISPPWAVANSPSIGLEQLAAVVREKFNGRAVAQVAYLNQVFCKWIGPELYKYVSEGMEGEVSGFGDWFFREVTFPDAEPNTEEYFQRYRVQFGGTWRERLMLATTVYRPRLKEFLTQWLSD